MATAPHEVASPHLYNIHTCALALYADPIRGECLTHIREILVVIVGFSMDMKDLCNISLSPTLNANVPYRTTIQP